MDLLCFLIVFLLILIVALVLVAFWQRRINKSGRNVFMTGSGNHIMETSKYAGHYSTCGKIEEADADW